MEQEKKSQAILETMVGLSIATTIILIILRAFGVITWSWWWVTAFLWVPFLGAILALVVGYIAFAIQTRRENKK